MNGDYGYVRVATSTPPVVVGDVDANVIALVSGAEQASAAGADIVVFPELCLTGYTCGDLFHQRRLLAASEAGLLRFAAETAGLETVLVVGLPVPADGRLFNCAAVVQQGAILGLTPKCYLPNHGEFYEKRWFSSGFDLRRREIDFAGGRLPAGVDLRFADDAHPEVVFAVELCEDLWAPTPPSTAAALAGATILLNLSASNDLVGKTDYRRGLVERHSAACLAAYAYCSAGVGESTTDVVFGGHRLIAENGHILADERTFGFEAELSLADVDIDFLLHERRRSQTFADAVARATADFRTIPFRLGETPVGDDRLVRPLAALPFVPGDPATRGAVCDEIFAIQSSGLAKRLRHLGSRDVVIGLSGGLDSTLALLVCVEAFARLGLPRTGLHGVTLPGFGTTERTLGNVRRICRLLDIPLREIDIVESCRRQFEVLAHPPEQHDTTFENVQARERTRILMDLANKHRGLVVGTGDLSELALGWCTYNGDHMSMYAVNLGVPKTLVAFLIRHVAESRYQGELATTLADILATPISPELLPPDDSGLIAQKTEEVVGPYELHDFFLYHAIRCGFTPRKVLFLAGKAFGERYADAVVRDWLRLFLKRFFSQQFKRSCIPDGPKVGTIALSPRGDWRMPSDACVNEWLADLDGPGANA